MIGLDLFSGAGGMSLGATWAGINVALAVENDAWAAKTYSANHPQASVYQADVRALAATELRPFAKQRDNLIVFGGPPCQGFSWSNLKTRALDNHDNWLFLEFVRVINYLRPAWFVFENVQGITNTVGGEFVNTLKTLLRPHYQLYESLLNAKCFAVPQDRTRYFLVGSREGLSYRPPTPLKERPLTVDAAIRDLPPLSNGDSLSWRPYGRKQPSQYARTLRRRRRGCFNHIVTRNAPYVIERYRHVPQGGNWENIPARMMKNYTDPSRCHTGIYHRLRNSRPSVVIGNFRKNMLIHPFQDRGLSVREAARIQSFPDGFRFFGSIGFQQQQVGNAVPPKLACAVFRSIIDTAALGDC